MMDHIQNDSPVNSAPQVVEDLIRQAESVGASDIHLQMTGSIAQIFLRLDGVMVPHGSLPGEIADRVFGRIKFLARLKTYQESLPQDGRIDKTEVGAQNDLRVATYPTVTGEKIVLRLFTGTGARGLRELEFPAAVGAELERFLAQTSGLLLFTGPAGSGKTTTIYACLRHLAGMGGRHIISVEDPVEIVIPGTMQTEINEARGLTFAQAARHLLRQDPQVLVIGEIRDDETANIAVRAALTGHLVITTLHAGSCRGVFERLLVMCEDRYSVISAIQLVFNQRLVRSLCRECAGRGCLQCHSTGYRGRVPLVEWLRLDDPQRNLIRERGPGVIQPPHSLEEAARDLLLRQSTDAKELARVVG